MKRQSQCPVCGLATCWWWQMAQDFPLVPVASKPLVYPKPPIRIRSNESLMDSS